MVVHDPVHGADVKLHHLAEVYVDVHQLVDDDLDAKLFRHLGDASLVPSDDLIHRQVVENSLVISLLPVVASVVPTPRLHSEDGCVPPLVPSALALTFICSLLLGYASLVDTRVVARDGGAAPVAAEEAAAAARIVERAKKATVLGPRQNWEVRELDRFSLLPGDCLSGTHVVPFVRVELRRPVTASQLPNNSCAEQKRNDTQLEVELREEIRDRRETCHHCDEDSAGCGQEIYHREGGSDNKCLLRSDKELNLKAGSVQASHIQVVLVPKLWLKVGDLLLEKQRAE